MSSYQSIKDQMALIVKKSEKVYMMNRDDIFMFLSELVAISQTIADFIRAIDKQCIEIENETRTMSADLSMAATNRLIKQKTAELTADKDWANRQLSVIKDIRITTLAAQRSAE